jgi:hypothetical protein
MATTTVSYSADQIRMALGDMRRKIRDGEDVVFDHLVDLVDQLAAVVARLEDKS